MNMNLKQILIFLVSVLIQKYLFFAWSNIVFIMIDILCTNLIDLVRKCIKTIFFTPDLFRERHIFQIIIINDIW